MIEGNPLPLPVKTDAGKVQSKSQLTYSNRQYNNYTIQCPGKHASLILLLLINRSIPISFLSTDQTDQNQPKA